MQIIDRYLFRQLLWPTLLATLALSTVALLTEALSSIGVILNQHQNPTVFVKVVILAMPQLIVLILPVAILVGGLVATNRMQKDNEIVICFSSGMSRWRVISPALRLSGIAALISLVITLWVQPLCYRALRDTLETVRTDLFTAMIHPGQFTHPAPGVTVYAQTFDEDGVISNLFINRRTSSGRDVTITARTGHLERRGGAPLLILRRGANQELTPAGVLNFLAFDAYVLDLRPVMPAHATVRYKLSDRFPHELFFPDLRSAWEAANRKSMWAEGHSRLSTPIYAVAFMSLALVAVLGGAFSRLGYSARIAGVCVIALVSRTLGFAAQSVAANEPALNALQYAIPLCVIIGCAAVLFGAGRRRRLAN